MKLCSLYIENFGCLSGFSLDFEDGLTAINQPNGFGKTTLAEFIRAMFYGFPRKTKTLEKSKRQKYTPWGGGTFGGNLVFEHAGQRYRIERTFGTTPKTDTFTLIDLATDRKSNRFSAEIGTELFGLDSDSFERSVYLPQAQEENLATAAIQAKLTDLVEDSSDVGNYDKALALLRAKRSALIPYRGSGGTAAEAAAKITGLQLQLEQAQHRHEQWKEVRCAADRTLYEQENTKRELVQIEQKLAAASETAALMVQRDRYAQLHREYEQVNVRCRTIKNDYPAGFPTQSELTEAEARTDKLAALENQIASCDVQGYLPSREELDTCHRSCEEYAAQQQKLRAAESALTEQMQKEREFLSMPVERTGAAPMVTAWIVFALGIGIGTALMLMKQLLSGGIALGAGVVAMLVAFALMFRRKKYLRTQAMQKKQESDRRIADAQQNIALMRQNCTRYSTEITQFFATCGMDIPPQNFPAGLAQLEHRVQISGQTGQWEAERAQLRAELDAFFTAYRQLPDSGMRVHLRQMRDDLRQIQTLTMQQQELADELAQMKQKYPDISTIPETAAVDMLPLRQEEQRLRDAYTKQTETLLQQKQEIQYLRSQAEQIPALQEELARLQNQLAADRENVRILDATMDFLQQARERLSTSYMDTIRSRFGWYMMQLEHLTGEKYLIDTDFQVFPERLGQARELAYFSAGQTDLVMLCMRLALVDALFKAEDMFVILDDPFVNLDDANTAKARKLLRDLAAKRQILYLTCNSSRTL